MDRHKVLIGLRDEAEAASLSEFLSGLGLDTITVADGAKALELAIQELPSVIAVDTALPVINGERLFQILRKNPHTSRVPFLFISESVIDVKGFRAGVDIFLIRPLNLEETYGRIRQTLSARGSMASKEIEGRLSQMSLADLLQFLHLNRKEGELKVLSGDRTGSVFIKDGSIHNAVVEATEREKALFRMLQWTDGRFEFIPKAVTTPKKIRASTGNLLMEGMRQIDELRSKEEQFPSPDSILKLKIDPATLPKGLQPIIYELVGLVRANSRVKDIVERSHSTDYEVYKAISSLVAKGVFEEARPAGAPVEQEFLTTDQMISIREKIMGRFADITGLNYGKILVLATSAGLVAEFIRECRKIPGFSFNAKSAFPDISLVNPLGEAGSFRLYGGMDLILYSIPTVKSMGPLWRSFTSNLVGLVLIWDEEGAGSIKDLAAAKRDIALLRRVPAVHVVKGRIDETACARELGMKADEHLFRLGAKERDEVSEVFYSLFGNLIKDDYAVV
ncbi:MAG: hypothetical protein A2054_03695 [Deltaproteobacteria bacterium GWA2_55_10]|nr:MAG: hypothetical protein A2054_03695 [Deltaproteobacteria bacterium GWA2_55_10]